MKGIFDAYVLWPFDKNLISQLVMGIRTREFTVIKNEDEKRSFLKWFGFSQIKYKFIKF